MEWGVEYISPDGGKLRPGATVSPREWHGKVEAERAPSGTSGLEACLIIKEKPCRG